jgi:serine/threonine protein kinase
MLLHTSTLTSLGAVLTSLGAVLTSLGAVLTSLGAVLLWYARAVLRQIGHGRKADIWSVGCVVIEMATGGVPWSEFSNKVR